MGNNTIAVRALPLSIRYITELYRPTTIISIYICIQHNRGRKRWVQIWGLQAQMATLMSRFHNLCSASPCPSLRSLSLSFSSDFIHILGLICDFLWIWWSYMIVIRLGILKLTFSVSLLLTDLDYFTLLLLSPNDMHRRSYD